MGFKLGQGVGTIPQVRKVQKFEFTENITRLHVFVGSDTLYLATNAPFCQICSHLSI